MARSSGQARGQSDSAFHPPPSITNVTTTFGGRAGRARPGSGRPSDAEKPSNPISRAVVGARSASETRSSTSRGSPTTPGKADVPDEGPSPRVGGVPPATGASPGRGEADRHDHGRQADGHGVQQAG